MKKNILSCIVLLNYYIFSYIMFSSDTMHLYFSDFYNPIIFIVTMSPTILSFIFLKYLKQNLADIKIKKENLRKSLLLSLKFSIFPLFIYLLTDEISNLNFVSIPMTLYIFLLALQEEIVFRGFLQKNLEISNKTIKEIILYMSWSGTHIFRGIYYAYYTRSIDTMFSVFGILFLLVAYRLLLYLGLRYIIKKTDNLWGAVNLHFLINLIYEMFSR